jgi:hypothetical protein
MLLLLLLLADAVYPGFRCCRVTTQQEQLHGAQQEVFNKQAELAQLMNLMGFS